MTAYRNVRIHVDYVLGRPSNHRRQSFQYYAPITPIVRTTFPRSREHGASLLQQPINKWRAARLLDTPYGQNAVSNGSF